MISQDFWDKQTKRTVAHLALLPFSWIFAIVSAIRRQCYRAGLFSVTKLNVPVVVIGNIVVGGGGKTPLVIALAQILKERGWQVGIAARGSAPSMPFVVQDDSDWQQCGDEPLLIRRRTNLSVCVCKNRVLAAKKLIELGCDLIICDDGLQHYALVRDVEICTMNATFALGNGLLLPAGPLREGAWRLSQCDAVVVSGGDDSAEEAENTTSRELQSAILPNNKLESETTPWFNCLMQLEGFYSLEKQIKITTDNLINKNKPIAALAGIAEPARFFQMLRKHGITINSEHPLPDHAAMNKDAINNLATTTNLLMTEKDAVKYPLCANAYYARISVTPPPQLIELIEHIIKNKESK